MSEELIQTIAQRIGKYTYYKLGSTTVRQLAVAGLIPKKNYGAVSKKKPDGLVLVDRTVKAVVEYKTPEELGSQALIDTAIQQEIEVARALCKLLIVTDGTKSFWVNALTGERIVDSAGNPITTVFNAVVVTNRDVIEGLIGAIDGSVGPSNSAIQPPRLIDPTPLATRLWQTIWVATGKTPVKCLYNVVELFVFKFLSDLNLLDKDVAFERIYQKSCSDPGGALDFYARNTRHEIHKLFPPGDDATAIINGTIFVNEKGEANLSQSIVFAKSLKHLNDYSEEFGSLTEIDRQFKTKLYETFLTQEVQAMGQYLTPRKIVQAMVRMAGLDDPGFQFAGKRFCDPFCGVGGFVLETINLNEQMKSCYVPDISGRINLPFVMHGFDKGFERDDERTIILAKANMLIYLAEVLFKHPNRTAQFARVINQTFRLFKDNLGTFGHVIKEEHEKYDFILSNPPYVTSGSSIIKEEIRTTPVTRDEYPINALGLEGLSVEWIVRSLKPGGRAFVVIPDGILARVKGKKLRDHILDHCYLDGIVSLPVRAFFANFKHTYILAVTKKHNPASRQREPVFSYLVSNIGERLSSVKREAIEENDLPEMEMLFRMFMASRGDATRLPMLQSKRCKVFDIEHFRGSPHWVVDRWWSREEKVTLGIEDALGRAGKDELENLLATLQAALEHFEIRAPAEEKEVALGDCRLFKLFIGKRITKKELPDMEGDIPAYSENVREPFGCISQSNVASFDGPSILWGIDGNFDFNLIPAGKPFATTDHCGTIQILSDQIRPEYILYALTQSKKEESFDRSFRASLHNIRLFKVKIPVAPDGSFDLRAQEQIAGDFLLWQERKAQLAEIKEQLDDAFRRYLSGAR